MFVIFKLLETRTLGAFVVFFVFFCCCIFFIFFLSFWTFVFFVVVVFLSFCHHYHNHMVNIYYHTNFCSNLTIFQFRSRSRRGGGHFGSSPLMDTLFWSLDNLSVTWLNLLRRLGFVQTPPPVGTLAQIWVLFLPMPLVGAWVNRWQVSPLLPPLPLPHLQIFVSLRYRTFLLGTENVVGGMGLWLSMPFCLMSLL